MTENEFLLEDRKQKIRSVVDQYGEDKFYVSFSGGARQYSAFKPYRSSVAR